jgi:hypothetical protein
LRIALVGAGYDLSYWTSCVKPIVDYAGSKWLNLIGVFPIEHTFLFLTRCKLLVSYQCGLGIVLHYLGGRVVTWWRPDGDSAHSSRKLMFHNGMRNAWINPALKHNYCGLLYGEQTAEQVGQMVEEKGWV